MGPATSGGVTPDTGPGEARTAWLPLLGVALAFAGIELGAMSVEPWGLFHDEVYYWACSRRLGLGYVDHPPLAPWLLAAIVTVFGDGRFAFAVVPAVCAALTVLVTGRMAARFGAAAFGQVLAGLCVAVAPVTLVFFSFYSVNALEVLAWTAASLLVVELIRGGDQRLWLALGAVAGLALLDKHTFAMFAFAVVLGVLASPLRAQLRGIWPWLGGGLALLLLLPNLYWNAVHDWPSLEFYRSRGEVGNVETSLVQALTLLWVAMNPFTALVWVPGVLALLGSRRLRAYRPFGIAFIALLVVILLSGQRRVDRIAGIFPVVLAAGASAWERWQVRRRALVRGGLIGLLFCAGLLVLPASVPISSPAGVARYFEVLGTKPDIEPGDATLAIPQHLLGRLEWDRFAAAVVAAWSTVPPSERERTVVLAPHWLYASTVEYYGRGLGLPPVVSPHNAYFFWRADAAGRDTVLAIAIKPEVLTRYFAETRLVATFVCEYCAPWRPNLPIVLARGPVRPLPDLLVEWRHFGLDAAPAFRPRGPGGVSEPPG